MGGNASSWGTIPRTMAGVAWTLPARVEASNEGLQGVNWPSGQREAQQLLCKRIKGKHRMSRAFPEVRPLLTAYAHQFYEPRPVKPNLIKAQNATTQRSPRRYKQADRIKELLGDESNAIICQMLTSLMRADLERVYGTVGEIARREDAGDLEKPIPCDSAQLPPIGGRECCA